MTGSCARTEILLGQLGLARLAETHVLIAGVGGVGGICAESLCRAGIGNPQKAEAFFENPLRS